MTAGRPAIVGLLGAAFAVLTLTGWEQARQESQPVGAIAFLRGKQDHSLWTMRPDGSAQLRLPPKHVAIDDVRWSPNASRIAFTATRRGLGKERSFVHDELFVVNANGSGARRLTWTRSASGPVFHANLSWSPNGRRIVFDRNDDGPDGIYAINANGRGRRALIRARRSGWLWPHNSALSPDGRRIALTDGTGVFVLSPGRASRPRPVARVRGSSPADLVWSPNGRKLALLNVSGRGNSLLVLNRDGSGLRNVTQTPSEWEVSGFSWSPDSRRIAVALQERFRDPFQIWLVNADGTGKRRLTTSTGGNNSPVWSPDGTRIAFTSERDGNSEIYVMGADGSNQTRLTHNSEDDFFPAWSPVK